MAKPYGIIGAGNAPDEAIIAALNDIESDAVFYILKNCKATDGQSAVYNWLIDYERTYRIYGSVIGPVLRDGAQKSGEGSVTSVIDMVKEDGGDTVLILWDDTEEVEEAILYADTNGMKVLELTNGLAPIEVDNDNAPEEKSTVTASVAEDSPQEEAGEFSRSEMENMPAAAVKRHAVTKGVDIKGLTKAEIIDVLFAEPEVAADVMVSEIHQGIERLSDFIDHPIQVTLFYKGGSVVNIANVDASIGEKILALLK